MPSNPLLKEVKPPANAPTVLYQPTSIFSVFGPPIPESVTGTVFCMNQGARDDRVSVALVTSGNALTSTSYITYRAVLHYGHSLYLQQICIGTNDAVYVTSENGTTNFILTGQSLS